MTSLRWYAAYVKSRTEAITASGLEHAGFQVFAPRIRTHHPQRGTASAPLFPGYLFIRHNLKEHGWPQLNRVPQALGLVQFDGVAAPIPDEVIDDLMRRLDEMNSTAGLWNTFRVGDTVRIRSGRLDSLAQVISEARSPQARVRVLMEFLGKQVSTEVPLQDIWPANGDTFLGAPPPTMPLRRTRGRGRWIKGFGPRAGENQGRQDNEYPLL
jgi:transcriptional antiterminator RfaH